MSNRLDQKREAEKQPIRMQRAIDKLVELDIIFAFDETSIVFKYKGSQVTFYPYSGWHTGKTINDGRGFDKLFNQIK